MAAGLGKLLSVADFGMPAPGCLRLLVECWRDLWNYWRQYSGGQCAISAKALFDLQSAAFRCLDLACVSTLESPKSQLRLSYSPEAAEDSRGELAMAVHDSLLASLLPLLIPARPMAPRAAGSESTLLTAALTNNLLVLLSRLLTAVVPPHLHCRLREKLQGLELLQLACDILRTSASSSRSSTPASAAAALFLNAMLTSDVRLHDGSCGYEVAEWQTVCIEGPLAVLRRRIDFQHARIARLQRGDNTVDAGGEDSSVTGAPNMRLPGVVGAALALLATCPASAVLSAEPADGELLVKTGKKTKGGGGRGRARAGKIQCISLDRVVPVTGSMQAMAAALQGFFRANPDISFLPARSVIDLLIACSMATETGGQLKDTLGGCYSFRSEVEGHQCPVSFLFFFVASETTLCGLSDRLHAAVEACAKCRRPSLLFITPKCTAICHQGVQDVLRLSNR